MTTYTDQTSENKDQALSDKEQKFSGGSTSALQFKDNRPEAETQRELNIQSRNHADSNPLKAMQLMADRSNRSKQLSSFSNGGVPIQMATEITYDAPQKFTYGAETEDVGTKAVAKLDPKDAIKGSNTAGAEQEALMGALPKATTWKKGHLLNHDLGGRGTVWNLFPITTSANSEHYHEVEKIVKHWIGNGKEASYEIKADAENAADPGNANAKFECKAKVENTKDGEDFHGHTINKTIHSHVPKKAWSRKFSKKAAENQVSFGSVTHNPLAPGEEQVKRDQYGKISTRASWDNLSGNQQLNRPDNDKTKGLKYKNVGGQLVITTIEPAAAQAVAPVAQAPAGPMVQNVPGPGGMQQGIGQQPAGQQIANSQASSSQAAPQSLNMVDDEEPDNGTDKGFPNFFGGLGSNGQSMGGFGMMGNPNPFLQNAPGYGIPNLQGGLGPGQFWGGLGMGNPNQQMQNGPGNLFPNLFGGLGGHGQPMGGFGMMGNPNPFLQNAQGPGIPNFQGGPVPGQFLGGLGAGNLNQQMQNGPGPMHPNLQGGFGGNGQAMGGFGMMGNPNPFLQNAPGPGIPNFQGGPGPGLFLGGLGMGNPNQQMQNGPGPMHPNLQGGFGGNGQAMGGFGMIGNQNPFLQNAPGPGIPNFQGGPGPNQYLQNGQGNWGQNNAAQAPDMDDDVEEEPYLAQVVPDGIVLEDGMDEEPRLGDPEAFEGELEPEAFEESLYEVTNDNEQQLINQGTFNQLNQLFHHLNDLNDECLENYNQFLELQASMLRFTFKHKFIQGYKLFEAKSGEMEELILHIDEWMNGVNDEVGGKGAAKQMLRFYSIAVHKKMENLKNIRPWVQ